MAQFLQRNPLALLASGALASAALLLASCGGSVSPTPASLSANAPDLTQAAAKFHFTTLDDQNYVMFNQLLGINDKGKIAGYDGDGMVSSGGAPNKGYTVVAPYAQSDFSNENFPGSAQTQVTGITNTGETCGFWVSTKGRVAGFVDWHGVFTSYSDPHGNGTTFNGINDAGMAVGFYTKGKGSKASTHGFVFDRNSGTFTNVAVPGGNSVSVNAINDTGDITGNYTLSTSSGTVAGFLRKANSKTPMEIEFPGATSTVPLGINVHDQIVGFYVMGTGSSAVTHGFLLDKPAMHARFVTIDDPNGVANTIVNGINDKGAMVGFYVDASGNTDGMLVNRAK
ncbi:MAG TPA: hypothetical protein VMF61_08020 [Candidatus Acidoferrales bacterium]|nr:hypothetical protein [Candidatus Acidoferrales bacterium]